MPYERLSREGRIRRRKRNTADYVGAGCISLTEVEDLLEEARASAAQARTWIEAHHPELKE